MSKSAIRPFAVSVLALLSVAAAGLVSAHHSFAAQYDSTKPVKKAGVVTRVEWTNPHVYLYIDVTEKSGATTKWGFEMGPPHMLQRAGWKKNSLALGEAVEVEGWAARDKSNTGNARRVTRSSTGEILGAASSSGQTLTGSSQPVPAPPAPTTAKKP